MRRRTASAEVRRNIEVREVSTGRQWALLAGGVDRSLPAWSPRGDAVFYREFRDDLTALGAVRVAGGHAIGRPMVLRTDVEDVGAMGFVDDDTFAYWRWPGPRDVLVVEANTSGAFNGQVPRRASHGKATMPVWSPDGRFLAWSDGLENGEVRVATSDGKTVRRIQTRTGAVFPAWSRDSRRVAFWSMSRLTQAPRRGRPGQRSDPRGASNFPSDDWHRFWPDVAAGQP